MTREEIEKLINKNYGIEFNTKCTPDEKDSFKISDVRTNQSTLTAFIIERLSMQNIPNSVSQLMAKKYYICLLHEPSKTLCFLKELNPYDYKTLRCTPTIIAIATEKNKITLMIDLGQTTKDLMVLKRTLVRVPEHYSFIDEKNTTKEPIVSPINALYVQC